jgi:hypothetical protein
VQSIRTLQLAVPPLPHTQSEKLRAIVIYMVRNVQNCGVLGLKASVEVLKAPLPQPQPYTGCPLSAALLVSVVVFVHRYL